MIDIFRAAAESLQGRPSGQFFSDLAGDLNSEFNIRQNMGFMTAGPRRVDVSSVKEMDIAELEVVMEFIEEAAERFFNIERLSVADLFAGAAQLCWNYLRLLKVESNCNSVYNELNSL
jgi:hypothetical protein